MISSRRGTHGKDEAMTSESRVIEAPFEVDVEDVEYLRHGDTPLLARIYRPRGHGPFPAVIDAHGGAWCVGSRVNNDPINMPVARGGVVVAALDFRMPPEASYPGSVADVHYGIRWLKANASRLGARADWVGTMGTSSGGHLVVLAALKPDDPRYATIPCPAGGDAHVPFVVALWPVICPVTRWRMHRDDPSSVGNPSAVIMQEKYWLTEAAMEEG